MSETTPRMGLKKPVQGELGWDVPIRATIDLLDAGVALIGHNHLGTYVPVDGLVINVKDHGVTGNGTTDDTTAIQAAISAGAGGVIVFPAGTYLTGNLTVPSNTTLSGAGWNSTVIQAKSGTTGSFIGLATPASTIRVGIRDLQVAGNGASANGVVFDNTGVTSDSQHVMVNVIVRAFAGNGVTLTGAVREAHLSRVISTGHTGAGIGFSIGTGATDNKFIACTAGVNLGTGFNVGGNNNLFIACKSFMAGSLDGVTFNAVDGWTIQSSGGQTLQAITLEGCEAQANGRHGYLLYNGGTALTGVAMNGCIADSNGAQTLDAFAGWRIDGAVNCNLNGCVAVNNAGQPGRSTAALSLNGVLTNFVASGCNFPGFTGAGPVSIGTATLMRVMNSPPFNPLAITAPSVPTSTTTYTNNFGADATVYVSGGTVTVIKVGGVTTGLTSGAFHVSAGQTIAVTYSSVPTWVWIGH